MWWNAYSVLYSLTQPTLSPSSLLLWGLSLYLLSALPVCYCVWHSNVSLLRSMREYGDLKRNLKRLASETTSSMIASTSRSSESTGSRESSPSTTLSPCPQIPVEVRVCGVISTVVLCLIGWQVYLTGHAPVYDYGISVPSDKHSYQIVDMNGDQSQWKLRRSDGMEFWLDWCTGPDEYDPKNYEAKVGYTIIRMKYQDKGCKSTMREDTGVLFNHEERQVAHE